MRWRRRPSPEERRGPELVLLLMIETRDPVVTEALRQEGAVRSYKQFLGNEWHHGAQYSYFLIHDRDEEQPPSYVTTMQFRVDEGALNRASLVEEVASMLAEIHVDRGPDFLETIDYFGARLKEPGEDGSVMGQDNFLYEARAAFARTLEGLDPPEPMPMPESVDWGGVLEQILKEDS